MERLHLKLKRRTRVVGIFPDWAALLRMVATLLADQDDEWHVVNRGYFSAESRGKLAQELEEVNSREIWSQRLREVRTCGHISTTSRDAT